MNKIKVASGRKGSGARLKRWVMLGDSDGVSAEYGAWLTASQARKLAKRLLAAADECELVQVLEAKS